MALMFKEVQVPIRLGHRVVHTMTPIVSRDCKATADLEVDQYRQGLVAFVELNRGNAPWGSNTQGRFKHLGSHQFTLKS